MFDLMRLLRERNLLPRSANRRRSVERGAAMSIATRRWVYLAVFLSAFVVPIGITTTDLILLPTGGDAARSWAAGLPQGQVDLAAVHLSDYPRAYRRALIGRMSPSAVAVAWRSHMSGFIRDHRDLKVEQVAAIRTSIALISPEVFVPRPDPERVAAIRFAAARVRFVLGDRAARELFTELGPARVTSTSVLPLRIRLAEALRSRLVLEADGPDCQCADDLWGCSLGMHCQAGADGCNPDTTWPACGLLWLDDCIGMCKLNDPD